MVGPGLVALIGGRPKVGKTTFSLGMVKAIARGEPFLGDATIQAGVLFLTEERESTLKPKWAAFGFGDDDDVHLLMHHQATGFSWPEIVEESVRYCTGSGLGVMFVDGWDKWSGVKDENEAVAVNGAMMPLLDAAAQGIGVVINAHQRKSKGEFGDAVRGSNALTGSVDIILELERGRREFSEEGGRVLHGVSRLQSTPERLALVWDIETGMYAAGDMDEIEYALDKDRVAAALDDEERLKNDISDKVGGMRNERLIAILAELVDEGIAFRTGTGTTKKGGGKFRWRRRTPEDDGDETAPSEDQDSGPEVREQSVSLNHQGLRLDSDSVPDYETQGGNRGTEASDEPSTTASQNGPGYRKPRWDDETQTFVFGESE